MDVKEFQAKYPKTEIEEIEDVAYYFDEDDNEVPEEVVYYILKNIPNLNDLILQLNPGDFERVDAIISSKPELFKEILGARVGKDAQVVLSRVQGSGFPSPLVRFDRESLKVATQHRGRAVSVHIYFSVPVSTDMGFLASRMVGLPSNSRQVLATVSGLPESSKYESDSKHILRSVLFDIELTYGPSLECANIENIKRRTPLLRKSRSAIPDEEISLVVKPYTPELIEYYHTAHRVDYVPFKFICYFHIIEYFMDKSAHRIVSKKLRQIMMRPDFHVSHSEYLSEAIRIFRTETEKNMTDKIKIGRVLSEYTDRNEINVFIQSNNLSNHFSKDHVLTGPKPLKIQSLNFDSDVSFNESLTKRVYSLRCSIVHSNPDFDESKAIPFHPNASNIDFLRSEIELMKELSRRVIVNSIE